MFTLECTRKLLARLGLAALDELAEPSTRLGNWCANVIPLGAREVVLLVSMRSLLPVLVPAGPIEAVVVGLRQALADVLPGIGAPAASVEAELRAMNEVRIGRTSSRQLLGSMTDFVYLAEAHFCSRDLVEVALKLAESPCNPIGMRSPGVVARELMELRVPGEGLDS